MARSLLNKTAAPLWIVAYTVVALAAPYLKIGSSHDE